MFVAVETYGAPLNYANAVAAAMQQVDPHQPIAEVTSMETLASRSLAQPAFGAALASAFAAVAVLLTTVGTYGLFNYAVARRRREIGLRLALGGAPRAIVALIVREGLKLGALGLILGVPAAYISSRAARNLLPASVSVDVVTVMTTVLILVAATTLACWIPAHRASRIPPIASLRAD